MGRGGGGRLFEVGANSRLGAYSNKYGTQGLKLDFPCGITFMCVCTQILCT